MADPTVASTVREMRRAGAAGEPVPADNAAAWAKVFMEQLYGMQKPVRYECRRRGSREPWEEAEPEDVTNPRRRNLTIRALYLHPPVVKQQHRWPPGSTGDGRCLDCDEAEWLAGPDCRPHAPLRDHRSSMPFRITWLIEPLEKLQYLTKFLSPLERTKWRNETTYLIDRIKDHEKGSQS
ncbi:hypothetical protein [Stenotrophomonas sp. Ste96]|uniref:hypothetical protein n=1 Tax=Stenotrophomonas sp. Ste96 TaxID=2926029 RepID=UPI0021C819A1|nr:hypothetical protein [Stenotrophomonas sp. Ste96]